MRIAFVNQPFDKVLPPAQNSLGIITWELSRRTAAQHPTLCYVRGGSSGMREHGETGVRFRLVPARADRRAQVWLRRLSLGRDPRRPLFASRWYHRLYARAIARDLRRERPDVVHVLNFSQFVPVIRRACPRAKIVLHMECEWLSQLDPALLESRLRATDLVLGCSEWIAQEVRKAFPHHAARCRSIPNGVDVERFGGGEPGVRPPGPWRLLFVGRVSPEKGVHVLLEAFRKVLERHPETVLDLVGSIGAAPREYIVPLSRDPLVRDLDPYWQGEYRTHLDALLTPAERERVRYRENLPNAELARLYREADVMVFPSVWNEPFGMPVAEAMSCGTPVVATHGGGIPEIIVDGETGLLVERGDASGLAAAVESLLDDPERRRLIGAAGVRRGREVFSWDHVADRLLGEYDMLEAAAKSLRPV